MAPFFIALAKGAEGRTGHKDGTREPVMAPLPYVIVYAVEPEMVHIFRVIHTSQEWP
jgi:plasmid stabilization system protein ParE